MKNTLLFLALAMSMSLTAQRYTTPMFQPEVVDSLIPYGTNASVLPIILGQSATPQPQTLNYRLFRPMGDTATNRPVVIIHHTGSYMPVPLNGGLTGSINDKAVTELAATFTSLGYVVVTPEYRAGWNTTAPDVDEQTSTLLIASLRGAQDMHMMTRYLRKTVAEDGNFLGIDAERILAIGLGTGGYNVQNSNFLDDVSEVNTLAKFIDSRNGLPYYDPAAFGNVYGTDQAQVNIPNWASYDNGFAMGVNLGGAMGDVTWIDGTADEAPMVGMHSNQDANAPFGIGNILVPTTGNTVLQDAPGSRVVVETCNTNGTNSILADINAQLLAAGEPLTTYVNSLKDVPFTTRDGYETTLSTENMYPFVFSNSTPYANTYNYADTAQLGPPIRAAIAAFSLPFTFEQLVAGEMASNPNFLDQAGARAVMDTVVRYVVPRAFAALELADLLVNTTEIDRLEAELVIAPNPARTTTQIRVREDLTIEEVSIINSTGQTLRTVRGNNSILDLDLSNIAKGIQYLMITTNEGTVVDRLLVD